MNRYADFIDGLAGAQRKGGECGSSKVFVLSGRSCKTTHPRQQNNPSRPHAAFCPFAFAYFAQRIVLAEKPTTRNITVHCGVVRGARLNGGGSGHNPNGNVLTICRSNASTPNSRLFLLYCGATRKTCPLPFAGSRGAGPGPGFWTPYFCSFLSSSEAKTIQTSKVQMVAMNMDPTT